MKILPDETNKERLIELWADVFGDEREYIELLFPQDKALCDIFAVPEGDKICSVLYLLDCVMTFKGKRYNGKYLYAAATYEKYRGRGMMASLIEEAQDFCKNSGFDFICLVPANENLYNYYDKFGFVTALHRTTVFGRCDDVLKPRYEISGKEYFSEREKISVDFIRFSGDSIRYAVSCLEYTGLKFFKNTDGHLFISEDNSLIVDEIIYEKSAVRYIVDDTLPEKRITEKYGMLYPINGDLKRNWNFRDLYINIALD